MTRFRQAVFVLLIATVVIVHPVTAGRSLLSPRVTTPTNASPGSTTSFVDVNPGDLPGNGTEADPYVITNASELQAIEDDLDANYTLGADVNASETAQWNNGSGFIPIGNSPFETATGPAFTGTFDGTGHTITDLTINRSGENYVGLFGFVDDGGVIRNVSLHALSITGSNRVGGLVGRNDGTIRGVSVNGSVTGSEWVGGLVGENSGTIRVASASGDVTGSDQERRKYVGGLVGLNTHGLIRNVSANGNVTGSLRVGGLVGVNDEGTVQAASASGDVTGSDQVGGLVGGNFRGTVRNASASGNVAGSRFVGGLVGDNFRGTIRNASASGNVTGSSYVGGLAGFNRGTIRVASASGDVIGTSYVGGLVGSNAWTIRVASASGDVTGSDHVGGLVGVMDLFSAIRNASASGTVTGSSHVGGLVGQNEGGTIRDTFAAGNVTGSTDVGGLVGAARGVPPVDSYWDVNATGQLASAGGTGLTTAEMTGEAARTNMTGLAFGTVWTTQPSDYPTLLSPIKDLKNGTSQSPVSVEPADLPGSGTQADPYIITNVTELQAIAGDLNANYTLGADINASGTVQWTNGSGFAPIGNNPFDTATGPAFTGTFDGAGHTITGLIINRSDDISVGLFGFVGTGGVVRNVTVHVFSIVGGGVAGGFVGRNAGTIRNVSMSGTVTGSDNVGGLVGFNDGTIQRVSVNGSVTGSTHVGGLVGSSVFGATIRNASASGNVSGSSDFVGGLVGDNQGTVWNVSASGDVTGSDNVGGLVGRNYGGTIRVASASGNVTGSFAVGGLVGRNSFRSTIRNASASGDVTGSSYVGGLVGFNREGTIQAASASGDVTASSDTVGGLVGGNREGTIRNTFAVGSVTGPSFVGGLVGRNRGPITDSYWDVNTTGQLTSAGNGTGLTTAEMTGEAARSNMTGLAFGTVWTTQPSDYPSLRALAPIERPQPITITIEGGSITPATVNESTTKTHDVGFVVEDVSKDGSTDVMFVTFPDAVAGNNLSASFANVTNLTDGSDVSITSSINQVDGPDNDSVVDSLRFAVSPTGSGTVDVIVNVSLDVTWPAVGNDTTYDIRAVVTDSSIGTVGPMTVASVTVVNATSGTVTLGDVNGDGAINTGDVIQVQRSIVGLSTDPAFSSAAADVNNDGSVNTGDVIQIQRFIVGLSSVLD